MLGELQDFQNADNVLLDNIVHKHIIALIVYKYWYCIFR